jgi:hypothetical protein
MKSIFSGKTFQLDGFVPELSLLKNWNAKYLMLNDSRMFKITKVSGCIDQINLEIGLSGVCALPLAAGINEGGHYFRYCQAQSQLQVKLSLKTELALFPLKPHMWRLLLHICGGCSSTYVAAAPPHMWRLLPTRESLFLNNSQ